MWVAGLLDVLEEDLAEGVPLLEVGRQAQWASPKQTPQCRCSRRTYERQINTLVLQRQITFQTHHALYSGFQCAFQPSGRVGGGGPAGGRTMMIDFLFFL